CVPTPGVQAKAIIDAGGRAAPVARLIGARRVVTDKLICGWVIGEQSDAATQLGYSYIEAEEHGWWYTAPLPNQRRILSFHTDVDLPSAGIAKHPEQLLQRAQSLPELSKRIADIRLPPNAPRGYTAAHSGSLTPCCGDGWLAVGDAAMCFDPLSSQGIFNAMYTGLCGAEVIDRHLRQGDGFEDYIMALRQIGEAYWQHYQYWYAQQTRWGESHFWARRQG
ncbi:MAG: hypothetical protein ETSY1_43995, partial [Candidatus Entotheonella factor]